VNLVFVVIVVEPKVKIRQST